MLALATKSMDRTVQLRRYFFLFLLVAAIFVLANWQAPLFATGVAFIALAMAGAPFFLLHFVRT